MKFSLRRLGALVGSATLALSLAACSNASSTSSTSSPASIDYSACATDDSAEQDANVDRSGSGSFPDVTGEDKPVIAAGTGAKPTTKALVNAPSAGDGASVCPGAKVKVNYVGALWNGTVFDSSYERGEPAEVSLTQVVKGWTYGLAHARVGDRLEVVIPASLGYGSQAKGTIPANSTLVFVVDILGVGRQNIADPSVLSSGVATGEELPEGIHTMLSEDATTLSGGQRQRAALARCLVRQQPVLLLDEPFSALDPALRQEMLSLVADVCEQQQLTLLMVSHSVEDAARIAPRSMVVAEGRIVWDGATAELLSGHSSAAHLMGISAR